MSFKRALVVDDSKSARLSLKKLLEQHHLEVDEAFSGEEALDFIKDHSVDVIFMDHTMPGMDGLEAVSAIKSNPKTATIPVMMYTTQEGEVYVGQARALGAVEVLPKQVQPGVLFEMLEKLGLVTDRRTEDQPVSMERRGQEPEAEETDLDREYERQALGMSVQALVTRILEDQHLKLRTDILRSQRHFAKQVAAEIGKAQAESSAAGGAGEQPARSAWTFLRSAAVVALFAGAGLLYHQTQTSIQTAVDRIDSAETLMSDTTRQISRELADEPEETEGDEVARGNLLAALQWAMNLGSRHAFEEPAFSSRRVEELRDLLTNLATAGFSGTVRLESHLGEFCLVPDGAGGFTLADPDLPVQACMLIGHPQEESTFVSERQSLDFVTFLQSTPLLRASGIRVELVAKDRDQSARRYDFPSAVASAGEWNRIAELNNRVEYALITAE